MARQIQHWGSLPEPGGLRDQPAGLLARLASVENVYDAQTSFNKAVNKAAWGVEHPEQWKVVQAVIELRQANG